MELSYSALDKRDYRAVVLCGGFDVMKKEPPGANLGDGHIHEVAKLQGG